MKNLYEEMGLKEILLIEDDSWTRRSLSLFFEFEGCSLQSAATAEEALCALAERRFDLILCEHQLPGTNGLFLLKLCRNHQTGAVKILFAPHVTEHLMKEAGQCGIHDVLRKPFKVETLENSILRHFHQERRRGPELVEVE